MENEVIELTDTSTVSLSSLESVIHLPLLSKTFPSGINKRVVSIDIDTTETSLLSPYHSESSNSDGSSFTSSMVRRWTDRW